MAASRCSHGPTAMKVYGTHEVIARACEASEAVLVPLGN